MGNIYFIAAALGLSGALFVVYAIYALRQAKNVEHVQEVLAKKPGRPMATPEGLESKILTGSILSRTLVPAFGRLLRWAGRFAPDTSFRDTSQLLTVAGNPMNLQAGTFYGLRIVLLGFGALLTLINVRTGGAIDLRAVMQAILTMLFFYFLPTIWLRNVAQERRRAIREELPDALDLLAVLASAGFNFTQAMARIHDQRDTVISREFGRIISEMEIGLSLDDALKNFADRTDVSEVSSFVALVIQSNRLGIRTVDVLQAQAAQMRVVRQFQTKEKAQKLPGKMMIPLALLILPALLYIVLAPAFINILQTF